MPNETTTAGGASWWMAKIADLYEKYGDDAGLILEALGALVSAPKPGKAKSENTGLALPSLATIRKGIWVHQTKRILAMEMNQAIPAGQPGYIDEKDALAKVEADMEALRTKPPADFEELKATAIAEKLAGKVGAGGQLLASVFAWFTANLPTIMADVKTVLQDIIALLPLFAQL